MAESLGSPEVTAIVASADLVIIILMIVALIVTIMVAVYSLNEQHENAVKLQRQQHKSTEKLQRQQLAIQVLSENSFEPAWIKALAHVFNIIRNNDDYNWGSLATTRFDGATELPKDKAKDYKQLKVVLNHFEFISIAVLNEAVDPDIIKLSEKYQMETVYDKCMLFIIEIRNQSGDKDLLINFTTLVEQWNSKDNSATST